MKQTLKIPEDCTTVSIEQVDNFKTHTATPIDWRANRGIYYHYVNLPHFEIKMQCDYRDAIDENLHSIGNYFKTIEEAQKAAEFLKTQLKQFKNKSI